VLTAAHASTISSREALGKLCNIYWYPLYCYIRRCGHDATEAEDLAQEFFTYLIENYGLRGVKHEHSRFRSYLLAALNHFLSNERDRSRTKKRGGGRKILNLDGATAEQRYARELIDSATPEKIFDRQWALTLLEVCMSRLRQDYADLGKSAVFEKLKEQLTSSRKETGYAEIASQLHMTEGAVKVAALRFRRRYRELIRDEISQTVSSAQEMEDEIQHLFDYASRIAAR